MHAAGNAVNNETIEDKVFGATVENAYRLVRVVEMYQWKENFEKRERNGRTETTYWYEAGWFSYPIDSSTFRQRDKVNPMNNWPFRTETFQAQNLMLGKFKLNPVHCASLGLNNTQYHWKDNGQSAIEATRAIMQKSHYSAFKLRGTDFVASTQDNDVLEPHIGQFRVRFYYNACGPATIMAQ